MYSKFTFFFLFSFIVAAQTTQKPLVESKNGMVVTTHPAASEIGLQILQKGGNAIDAAVAVNFALAVCHPAAGNIGGGGFLVYRSAKGRAYTLDYREKAPIKANRDMYLDSAGNVIPGKSLIGIFSAGCLEFSGTRNNFSGFAFSAHSIFDLFSGKSRKTF
jgi:gamma-glutamyltranspeptidase/glutathione hydrolase